MRVDFPSLSYSCKTLSAFSTMTLEEGEGVGYVGSDIEARGHSSSKTLILTSTRKSLRILGLIAGGSSEIREWIRDLRDLTLSRSSSTLSLYSPSLIPIRNARSEPWRRR